jgi:predicted transposase/invertase (TIGR01784 family)
MFIKLDHLFFGTLLIARTQQQIDLEPQQQQLLQLIETILIYKFSDRSREEIESMFGLSDLQQTRVYQEGKEEGKQEGLEEGAIREKLRIISVLLRLGLTIEDTAKELSLTVEEVRQESQK